MHKSLSDNVTVPCNYGCRHNYKPNKLSCVPQQTQPQGRTPNKNKGHYHIVLSNKFLLVVALVNIRHSLNCYLTLRSFYFLQVFITIGLTAFVIKLAKNELEKKMPNKQTEKSASVNSSSQTENTDCQTLQTNSLCVTDTPAASIPRTRSHSRNMSVNIPPIVDGLTKNNFDMV